MLHPVTVELGGKTRTLKCDIGAMAALEDMGVDPIALIESLRTKKMTFKTVQMLTAAMLWEENVTLQDVGKWVSVDRFADVASKVMALLRASFAATEEASEEPNPPRRGTAKKSSSSALTAT